ncbi:MAG: NfeD family protein [Dehalococcoidales bacterium]|nr:NfeD family protein [Dehalococcoidales bacterium]
MEFADTWLWLIFVGTGLLFVLIELLVGVDTGLDLVFVGTALIIGGLITWPLNLWAVTIVVTALICVAYVFIGRRYIHRRLAVKLEKTNIDTVIGSTGVVLQSIKRNNVGRVRVGNERWRARSEQDIPEGSEITVTGVTGATLTVEKL